MPDNAIASGSCRTVGCRMRGAARALRIDEQAQIGLRHAEVDHRGKSRPWRIHALKAAVRVVENGACVSGTSTGEKQAAQHHFRFACMKGVAPPIERGRSRTEHALGSSVAAFSQQTLTVSEHGAGSAAGNRGRRAIRCPSFCRVQNGHWFGCHSLQRARLPHVRRPGSQKRERESSGVAGRVEKHDRSALNQRPEGFRRRRADHRNVDRHESTQPEVPRVGKIGKREKSRGRGSVMLEPVDDRRRRA